MITSQEVERDRIQGIEKRAPMQKLEVTGHLLPGTDISAGNIKRFLTDLGPICGMNIFNGPHVKTPDSYDIETKKRLGGKAPEDVNGSLMWDDSGAQIYVFPREGNYFTLDIYTCKTLNAERALEFVYNKLHPREDMRFAETNHSVKTEWTGYTRPDDMPLGPENKYLSDIDRLFDTDLEDPNQVIDSGRRLEYLVQKAVDEGIGERVAASYTADQRVQLRDLHSVYEVAVDDRFMDEILAGVATSPDQYPFQPTYDRLSFMEGQAIGADDRKPIMHIGTGWPGTAIGLYRQFGTPVTCIEIDPIVAQKSRDALEKLGLLGRDKIRVINADGATVNPDGFKALIISAMVPREYKARIMRNAHDLSDDVLETAIILRTPSDKVRSLFYQELEISPNGNILADTAEFMTSQDPLRSIVYKMRIPEGARGDMRARMAHARLQPVEGVTPWRIPLIVDKIHK